MVQELRREFEEIFFSNVSTTKGLETVAKNIGISKNSMRRFLGKLNDNTQLRPSTLNLIAGRLGYKDFHDFCNRHRTQRHTLDFNLLDIFYGTLKGKEAPVKEPHFQAANYYFAEKIIADPQNLKEFLKRYSDNQAALEFVLAWHPSYEKVGHLYYRDVLAAVAKLSQKAHLKVFALSFLYFGKFMSENLDPEESRKMITQIEKQVQKMRAEDTSFHAFPEARYMIAKCIYHKILNGNKDSKTLSAELQREISLAHLTELSLSDRIIYSAYVADILNMMGDYENADLCFGEDLSDKKLSAFEEQYRDFRTNAFLYRLNRAITLYHLGRKDESMTHFEKIPSDLNNIKSFSFDTSKYFELRYLLFAKDLSPEKEEISRRIDMLVKQMNFTYLNQH
ncbi:MAG: hypothetical protein I8H68_11425 [Flavobacteriia bacterium]|nr:hypothetical protein [Flavobacteriia bacterium]MBH2024777.1 hypothetical protein [Flavobacteriales bacterium]